jgi:hypothetical protein
MFRPLSILLLFALLPLGACKRSKNAGSSGQNSREISRPSFDACGLITGSEIEAVEGSPVKDIKPSGNASNGLQFAQCFYTTAEFSRSVSLAATLSDSGKSDRRSVRQFWQDTFGKYQHEEKKTEPDSDTDKEKRESLHQQKRERGEEEEEGTPPKKIPGIGEEAFWLGNRVGGALYVLKKDVLIRISVGGPDPEQGKIDKCKALAEKALGRL